ncbi:MAG: sulfite exporter TauE/SafE family protein [Bacteriovoracaceae bacterium]|nr:sulfite exporter TauE/SafE family protein [Bacteriovoracaceae bacterium]
MISVPLTLLLGFAVILTAIISGVVGMAGGVTLLSFMTFFMSMEVIVPIHGIVQLSSNFSRCFFLKDKIHKRISLFFFLGAPIGTMITFFLIKEIKHKEFLLIPMAILIFYTVLKPKKLPHIFIPHWGFLLLGILTGVLAPLIGATGPLLAPFFLRNDLDKEQIVATKAITQMFTHLLKIPLFLALDFPYQDYLFPLVFMVISAIIGTRIGVSLLGKVSEKIFILIYKIALLLAGIRILTKIFLV